MNIFADIRIRLKPELEVFRLIGTFVRTKDGRTE